MIRAIDPVAKRLADGKEYHFFLSHAALRRAARRVPNESKDSPLSLSIEILGPVFYEACEEKAEISFEDFEEILPGDTDLLGSWLTELRAHARSASENPIVASGSSVNPTG
jgi:hypothetical protein